MFSYGWLWWNSIGELKEDSENVEVVREEMQCDFSFTSASRLQRLLSHARILDLVVGPRHLSQSYVMCELHKLDEAAR